jgi:hypothetical protein
VNKGTNSYFSLLKGGAMLNRIGTETSLMMAASMSPDALEPSIVRPQAPPKTPVLTDRYHEHSTNNTLLTTRYMITGQIHPSMVGELQRRGGTLKVGNMPERMEAFHPGYGLRNLKYAGTFLFSNLPVILFENHSPIGGERGYTKWYKIVCLDSFYFNIKTIAQFAGPIKKFDCFWTSETPYIQIRFKAIVVKYVCERMDEIYTFSVNEILNWRKTYGY